MKPNTELDINSYIHPMSPYDIQHPSPRLNRRHHRRSGSAMALNIIDRLHELALLDERHVRRLRDAVDVGHLEVGDIVEVVAVLRDLLLVLGEACRLAPVVHHRTCV